MSTSNNYIVFPIPNDPPSTCITEYITLRLLSLRTDPARFSSNYERESQFSNETWRTRLGAPDKVTVVAAVASTTEDEGEWVGTVTILAPAALRGTGFKPPAIEAEVYALFAMWVHPEHRGKGLGRRLAHAGLEWVRMHGIENTGRKWTSSVVVVGVGEDNESARALYRTVGFREVDDLAQVKAGTVQTVQMVVDVR